MPGNRPTALQSLTIFLIIPILSSANQLLLKHMSLGLPHVDLGLGWLWQIVGNPWLLAVLFCEILTFVLWLGVLKNVNLSRATPITAISYIMILLAGWLFFGETVHIVQILGILAIIFGLHLLSPG
jgi:drug/metabolite transporter (DMT)-like permease